MSINHMSIAFLLTMSMSTSAFAAGSDGHDHGDSNQPQSTQGSTGEHAGGGGDHGGSDHGMMEHMSGMMPDRTVEVTARDIEFSTPEIAVAPGETIRFVIHNTGQMAHDFTIGDQATQESHREEMMSMMSSGSDMMDHMHSSENAVLIEPGETAEIVWTFADGEGLQFGCNVPGHYEAGMHGRFVMTE